MPNLSGSDQIRLAKTACPTDTEAEHCIRIFQGAMAARQRFLSAAAGVAASMDLQVTEMSALNTLGRFGPMTMGELAKRSVISPPNTTRSVKALEEAKLVHRQRSPQSDRVVNVSLTSKGRKLFENAYPFVVREVSDLLKAKLTERERRTLDKLLTKLSQ